VKKKKKISEQEDKEFIIKERPLQEILSTRFVIPKFQREYSWKKEQVEEFWDDCYDYNSMKNYAFGPMVFKTNDSYSSLVIDGQQRITTCVILITFLRDILKSKNKSKNLKKYEAIIGEASPRIQLSDYNKEDFETLLKYEKPSEKIK
jgi:uncharacterized protein with ParB-like and HNH nuclease domain